jgi:hypothetical protein
MLSFKPENVPVDILQPVLAQLSDRRDLHAAALVSRTFNVAATPVSALNFVLQIDGVFIIFL